MRKPGRVSILKSHSFYVRIVSAFVGLLLITVLPMVLYTYHQNTGIVLELSDNLLNQVSRAVIEKTTNFLMPAAVMVEMSARLAQTGVLSPDRDQQLELYTVGVLKSYPQVCMFFLGTEQGDYHRSWRLPDGRIEFRLIHRTPSPPTDTIKFCDPYCNVIRTEKSHKMEYDPRVRPWYQGARETRTYYWTDLYVLFRNKKPAVTSAYPLIDTGGNLLGVWGMDIELEEMSNFLKGLKVGQNGLAFIINQKNEVVAFPDASRIVKEEQAALRPVQVEELGLDGVTAAFRHYSQTGRAKAVVASRGKRYVASFQPFPPTFPAPWKVAVVAPEDDFIGPAKRVIRDTLLLCLLILLSSILLAALLARSISRPINLLTEETKSIKDFRLEEKTVIHSHIKEIQLMTRAMAAMRSGLKAFRRYVPAELVRQLIQTGEEAHLGGQKREITVFFSDIAGFTGLAESLAPEELMLHLSEYFDALTRIISHQQGTVDKYIGDGIMAFWGAPLFDADHAGHACEAALRCQEKLQELNRQWQSQGKPVLATRIGISTGETVVGNVGSSERLNYTVMGDNVNLASRLEGVNRLYGTQILVSRATFEQAAGQFWFRPLDVIAVQGKTRETVVYELLGRKRAGAADFPADLCQDFQRGFAAYLQRDWAGAGAIFEHLLYRFPDDAAAALYLSRCRNFQLEPPAPDWRGVTSLASK